jgi:hypothetical protein
LKLWFNSFLISHSETATANFKVIPQLNRVADTPVGRHRGYGFLELTHKLQNQFHLVSDLDGF